MLRKTGSASIWKKLILEETEPFAAKGHANISLRGSKVQLAPRGALAIGMAIHALATNALKYGALSVPDDRVEVTWQVKNDGVGKALVLEWVEINGPRVETPTRPGFGTALIERGIAHELSDETTLQFNESGEHATIKAPMSNGNAAGERIRSRSP